jgi:outer membrane protein assembly factor BamB
MNVRVRNVTVVAILIVGCGASVAGAQDWPQWRGANRDGKATGFVAPAAWPAQLTEKWKITVGDGVATPAVVGDKVFVFTRQGGDEVIRCLEAATGKEVWQQKYAAAAIGGPSAQQFSGPRSSPAVADGKVVTLGVQGVLSCYDANSGKLVWRKEEYQKATPQFFTASSPMIVAGLCIAELGGGGNGAIVAYDVGLGDETWKWTGDAAAYASPVLMNIDNTQVIVTPTEKNIVAINVADGKLLWQVEFQQGRYNAATPIVDGQTLIYALQGTTAEKVTLTGDGIKTEQLWNNPDAKVIFNSPVLKDGLIYGLSDANAVFCVRADTGQTAWTAPLSSAAAAPQPKPEPGKGRRGGGGRGGFGSIVDAGPVLFALSPAGDLVVFEPSDKEFKQVASYKVSAGTSYAYPVIAGNRVLIKDGDALTLWTIE